MHRYVELEWDQNKIIHSPRIKSIFGDLASPNVKGVSPNCKNLSSRRLMRCLVGGGKKRGCRGSRIRLTTVRAVRGSRDLR
jgi:hypothetical protein